MLDETPQFHGAVIHRPSSEDLGLEGKQTVLCAIEPNIGVSIIPSTAQKTDYVRAVSRDILRSGNVMWAASLMHSPSIGLFNILDLLQRVEF